ncbi:hypothetical protein LTR36_008073 [Oleoguttula mirabilis]|uniref:Uncharacterized protein n=1 Tax=Oleoguttula mirabilis TaxID=1507867 RepID=A0AAV9JA84_9PEZI|nr:hypothetical protein LTR36_008073 [Oleoguttula mirabilis]
MSGHDAVAELIAVLDQWLREKDGITTSRPDITSVLDDVARASSCSPFATTDVPPSLAIYPNTSLATHMLQHDQNLASLHRLRARASALCLDQQTALAANKQLMAEYLQLDSSLRVPGYEKLPLDKKVKALRTAQQQAREPLAETFAVTVVRGIGSSGASDELTTHHLPAITTWAAFQDVLRDATKGWRAREAGFAEGYSLRFGKWLYQVSDHDVLEKDEYDLTSEAEYQVLRKRLRDPHVYVMVWHERIWEASKAARALWCAICEEEKERAEDEWVKRHGWLPFHPDLDPTFRAAGEWDIGGEVGVVGDGRAPSVEPLSDQEEQPGSADSKGTSDERVAEGGPDAVEVGKAPSVEPLSEQEEQPGPVKRKSTSDEDERVAKKAKAKASCLKPLTAREVRPSPVQRKATGQEDEGMAKKMKPQTRSRSRKQDRG